VSKPLPMSGNVRQKNTLTFGVRCQVVGVGSAARARSLVTPGKACDSESDAGTHSQSIWTTLLSIIIAAIL
jgi:hypothetical protein